MKPTSRQTRIAIVAVGLAALLSFANFVDGPWFVLNETESVSTGLYWLDDDVELAVGDLVWLEVPAPVAELVRERGYLPAKGKLLKRVVAREGASWCVDGDRRFVVESESHGEAFLFDTLGKPLSPIQGCSVVPPGHVLVAGDHPRSFDSRYFGAIPIQSVVGEARPLWISSH